ncbi:basic leucine zipper transcriptional factor ATF-like 2 [Ambystoma mexicanum]|uniref:basic leucine zipper transcriptional factor ATF-like 2 n=1 Tax=Ambystoma mexicanum TaxID=8296 RepID=UPI0037E9A08D
MEPPHSSSCGSISEDSQDMCFVVQYIQTCKNPKEVVGRKLKKREKNRAAAQKSRQKQTEKADLLHQEHECLEKDNTALKKEIASLNQELRYWSKALHDHERTCIMCCPDVYLDLLHNAHPPWADEGVKVSAI